MSQSWKDLAVILRNFLKSPQEVGAIAPSSRYLAKLMVNCIDLQKARVVVELGAGTGAITAEVLSRTSAGQRVLIIDLNPDSISVLREKLKNRPDAEVILADARSLQSVLQARNIHKADAIISSLPYASLGPGITGDILAAAAGVLAPEGHFVAFQYTAMLRKVFEKHFSISSSKIELRNFPPAVVYDCVPKSKPAQGGFERKSA